MSNHDTRPDSPAIGRSALNVGRSRSTDAPTIAPDATGVWRLIGAATSPSPDGAQPRHP